MAEAVTPIESAHTDGTLAALKPALGRNIALPHARRLVELLRPACQRVEIAGSLRREKDAVADIEIVALPDNGWQGRYTPSLFADPDASDRYAPCEEFDALLRSLVASGVLRYDPNTRRDGPRYKRFLLPALSGPGYEQGFGVDLFIADPDNWGNTLAIRTGSAAFSKFLMSSAWSRKRRRQQDGHLWQCLPGDDYAAGVPAGRERIACKTEEGYFEAVGVPFVEPRFRSEFAIARMRKEGL